MIARMWHGITAAAKGDAYADFLRARAIPDYRGTPGNLSVHILRRDEGGTTHFITLTFWESLDAIRAFAGEQVERAKYYPEDKNFLLEFEPSAQHWEVVGSAKP
jgi:heme-degrading monooxygenase HmoA